MTIADFHDRHRKEWDRQAVDTIRAEAIRSWFRTDTADYWRHARMYEPARAFIHRPELSWLTVGDGRFGLDSIRLRRLGISSVLPTDIGDALLKQAKAEGLIDDFAAENAESLSFADNSFDVVFCKESYHHCPRGPLALYEMLRVAREAVILIEPRDYVIDHGPNRTTGPVGLVRGFLAWCRDRLKVPPRKAPVESRYLTGDAPHFEDSGNYMYTISSRELEKVALGINLPAVAFKGLNDTYIEGGETESAADESALFRSMKESIQAADQRTEGGRGSTSMLMAILFKAKPDEPAKAFLRQNGWLCRDLPRNPYI
jgi:SAM-dependent methyltransferase